MTKGRNIIGNNSVKEKQYLLPLISKNQKVSSKIIVKQFHQATFLSNLTNYLFSYIKAPKIQLFDILNQVDVLVNNEDDRREIIRKSADLTRKIIMIYFFMLKKQV